MLRKGFTLIELLVVIAIIAILAGAAIPYVQDYVSDAKYSKAQSDLGEISNALTRYEVDNNRSYTLTDLSALVGPYLQKAYVDPWGAPYLISNASSTCYTYGPDGTSGGGDDITVSFRPPLSLTKAYWEDSDGSGGYSVGDSLILRFSRPVDTSSMVAGDKITIDSVAANAGWYTAPNDPGSFSSDLKGVRVTIADVTTGQDALFKPGRAVLQPVDNTLIKDPAGNGIQVPPTVVAKAR